jgi:peptidoglycan-N-acetylglucosamine deacetylase
MPARRTPPHWAVRARLSPDARAFARRWVDGAGAPILGSLKGSSCLSRVALTFDDGPDESVTPRLLDALGRHQASATFFVLLCQVRRHPELVRRAVAEGHEIALHGGDHQRLTRRTHRHALEYLHAAKAELESLCDTSVSYYRPPFGAQTVSTLIAARRSGLDVVAWSCDAADWEDRDVSAVCDSAMARLAPGGILLLHERLEPDPESVAPTTTFDRVELVEMILNRTAAKGWHAVTVSGLLEEARPRRTVWLRP